MSSGRFECVLLLGMVFLTACSSPAPATAVRAETRLPITTQVPVQSEPIKATPTHLLLTETLPVSGSTGTPTAYTPTYITEKDNGKTFTYQITSRFGVTLDESKYPLDQLKCEPEPIFG